MFLRRSDRVVNSSSLYVSMTQGKVRQICRSGGFPKRPSGHYALPRLRHSRPYPTYLPEKQRRLGMLRRCRNTLGCSQTQRLPGCLASGHGAQTASSFPCSWSTVEWTQVPWSFDRFLVAVLCVGTFFRLPLPFLSRQSCSRLDFLMTVDPGRWGLPASTIQEAPAACDFTIINDHQYGISMM